ncbi:hypothetical protein [Amycolatopsis sp. NBC_01480]|uniref:hypothetical protein n=1 Tax=Amycolatopsis sp. NBC_01480 TaxID=2903562 RepID=UPI002E2B746B|nr:hypothetical protein [Amycolatopsis sp. NBC_01480]
MTGAHFGAAGSAGSGKPSASGDAGQDFLSGLLAGPTDTAAAQKVNTGGAELKSLAEKGSFAVNEAGLQAYVKACNFFLEGYDRMYQDVQMLSQAAQMGSSPYAHAVADFNVKVANGDPQSLLPNLELMRKGVEQARDALTIARKNYRETEDAHSTSFAELNKELNDK